jgi:hypothetical protein
MIRKINASLKEGLQERNKMASKTLQNEKGNAITACYFIITLEISSSEIDMGEGISTGNEALWMSEKSTSGISRKNCTFRASALSEGVVAFLCCMMQ